MARMAAAGVVMMNFGFLVVMVVYTSAMGSPATRGAVCALHRVLAVSLAAMLALVVLAAAVGEAFALVLDLVHLGRTLGVILMNARLATFATAGATWAPDMAAVLVLGVAFLHALVQAATMGAALVLLVSLAALLVVVVLDVLCAVMMYFVLCHRFDLRIRAGQDRPSIWQRRLYARNL